MYLKMIKKSWEDKHNFYNSFSSVDPTQYDRELDYLDDLRKQWKEYYDPSDMYDVIERIMIMKRSIWKLLNNILNQV